jgi:NitT/TauT family transport system permease protein
MMTTYPLEANALPGFFVVPTQCEQSKSVRMMKASKAQIEQPARDNQPHPRALLPHQLPLSPVQASGVSVPSTTPPFARILKQSLRKLLVPALTLTVLVLAWWAIAALGQYPTYLLPTPAGVAERWWSMLLDGSLLGHFGTTILEAGLGFLVALVLGVVLGYLISHVHVLERVINPYIAISQGLPIIAIAPLLVLWVGNDLTRKVIVVALIVFFPIVVNTVVGLRSIDRSMLEVARISGANLWQTIRYVELPLSLRGVLAGVKLGLTLSITGAIVSEFVSSSSGLGFLLMLGRGLFDTTLIFVGLISLVMLTLATYFSITLIEKTVIDWE